jgi:hypothetical protein
MSPELLPSSARTSKTHGAIYAALLSSFGMLERLEHLLDAPFDKRGLAQERARLPQRIHASPTIASDPDALKKMGLS